MNSYELGPLKLFFHRGGLYLYATLDGKSIATFAVERFVKLEKTRKTFRPPSVNLEAKLRQAFCVVDGKPVTVEVVFSPQVALYVKERQWHPHQKLIDMADGSVKFVARMEGHEEFLSWVLSWGRHAERIRPAAWRRELAEHALELLTLYGPPCA